MSEIFGGPHEYKFSYEKKRQQTEHVEIIMNFSFTSIPSVNSCVTQNDSKYFPFRIFLASKLIPLLFYSIGKRGELLCVYAMEESNYASALATLTSEKKT